MKRPSRSEKDLTGEYVVDWEKYAFKLEYYTRCLEEYSDWLERGNELLKDSLGGWLDLNYDLRAKEEE